MGNHYSDLGEAVVSHIQESPNGLRVWLGPSGADPHQPPSLLITDPLRADSIRDAWSSGGHPRIHLADFATLDEEPDL